MSFASEVKKELLSIDNLPCCQQAVTSGILQGAADVSLTSQGVKLIIKSHLSNVLKFLVPYLRKKYGTNAEISYIEKKGITNRRIYYMEIIEHAQQIIDEFHLFPLDSVVIDDTVFENDCCKSAFTRGCFIAKGSINDPKKNCYHLEIIFRKIEVATLVQTFLKENDILATIMNKKNQYLLYIKKAEEVSRFLAYVGANSGVFYFEDSRILRDLNNSVNRIMNCDIANGSKSLEYCQKQMKAIAYLDEHNLTSKLTNRLQDAIQLRKEYTDASLTELSELSEKVLGKQMSKSGISHCLTEVMKYYEYYANKENKRGQ